MATSTPKASSSAKKSGAGSAKDTLDWRIKELRAFDVSRIQDRWDPVLESLHKSVNTALSEVLGNNSPDYRKFAIETFDATLALDFSGRYSIEELQRSVQDNIAQAIITLDRVKALIRERSRQQPAAPAPAEPPPAAAAPPAAVAAPAPAAVAPPAVRPAPIEPTPLAKPEPAAPASVAPVAPAPIAVKAPTPVPAPVPAPVAAPAVAPPPIVPAPSPAPPPAAAPAPVVVAAQTPQPMPVPTPAATVPAAVPAAPAPAAKPQPAAAPATVRVAIIGGHNTPARQATSDFIQQLGLQTANRQAGEGLYLDRLEGLRDLQYAVVLLPASTLDPASGQPKAVPPELLMELGFVLGHLGRSRVCFLVSGEAKIPAWQGITNLRMDDDGLWHLLLARAMKQAGLDVDLNRAV